MLNTDQHLMREAFEAAEALLGQCVQNGTISPDKGIATLKTCLWEKGTAPDRHEARKLWFA